MQKMKDNNARELNHTIEQHQQEVGNLKRILDKAYRWFPSFKRFPNMERECLQYGFSEEQTKKLPHGQTVNYCGWLHSNEYRRNVLVLPMGKIEIAVQLRTAISKYIPIKA